MSFLRKLKNGNGFFLGVGLTSAFFLFTNAKSANDPFFEISKNLDIYSNIFKELNAFYVDPIEPGKLVKTGVDAMLEDLDPYTNFVTEADIEEYQFMMTGKYSGIGANVQRKGDVLYLADVFEGSPAQKAGMHPGDILISIDNQSVKGKSVDDLSVLLKGTPGTSINIKIIDAYTQNEVTKVVTRGEVEVAAVPFAALLGTDKNIAMVKLSQFTQGCARQLKDAIDSLQKVQPNLKGLVLDLRNNPGGLVEEAVKIVNLFINKDQLVVNTKGKIPDMDKEYKTADLPWNMEIPLAILVNKSSASASEIVSGSLQDMDRAVILGERSYGKGLVQVVRNLGFNAKLKLTVAKYYTPSGRCIQAIDYSHRNADKSVSRFADSLKKSYKTFNGRTVLSLGGIDPDIKVHNDGMAKITSSMLTKNIFFDYATEYAGKHPTITDPSNFSLTDAEFQDFMKWAEKKEYGYQTDAEVAFDSLKSVAMREKSYDETRKEFDALKSKLSHDKKQDLMKNKDNVKETLENEIVSRYYFSKGRAAYSLKHDIEMDKAISILQNTAEYNSLLKPKK